MTCPGCGDSTQDAVADDDRFLDGMGDEQHGEADIVPKLKQFFLHAPPGQGIERGERLVHQQDFRLHRQARAIATRCFMPPDRVCG